MLRRRILSWKIVGDTAGTNLPNLRQHLGKTWQPLPNFERSFFAGWQSRQAGWRSQPHLGVRVGLDGRVGPDLGAQPYEDTVTNNLNSWRLGGVRHPHLLTKWISSKPARTCSKLSKPSLQIQSTHHSRTPFWRKNETLLFVRGDFPANDRILLTIFGKLTELLHISADIFWTLIKKFIIFRYWTRG